MPYRFSSTAGNLIKPRPECLNTSTGAIIRPLLYSAPFEMWNGVVEYYTTGGSGTTRSFALGSPSQVYDPTKAYDGDVNTYCYGGTDILSPNPTTQVWQCTQSQASLASVTLKIKRTYQTQTPTDNGLTVCVLEYKWSHQASWNVLHTASGTNKITLDYESFQIDVPRPPQIIESLSGLFIRCSVTGDWRWNERLQEYVWTSASTDIYDMYLEYSYT